MEYMVRAVAANHAIPVVISPFVLGAQRSNRIARRCVSLLEKRVAAAPDACYVAAYPALDRLPRRQMLLQDGSHLSIQGQAVVAECLWPVLTRVLREQREKIAARAPVRTAPPQANGTARQLSVAP
jgi:lysophospholipase L1-like esterase